MRSVSRVAAACAAALIVSLATSLAAHATDPVPENVPGHLRAGVDAARRTGLLLHQHDRAALVASDLLPMVPAEPGLMQKIDGWITMPARDAVRVIFHDDAEPARAVVIIDVGDDGTNMAMQAPGDAPLDAAEAALVRVRRAAIADNWGRCARDYNTVTLHSDGEVHVYLMPWLDQAVPVGGYHLFAYDARGETLLRKRPFTSGCMNLAFREALPDRTPRAELVTHVLDPHPTEIHFFASLLAPAPLAVLTGGADAADPPMFWQLDSGRIGSFAFPTVVH